MSAEQLVDLAVGFSPEAAVSGALLLQSERATILTFNAMRPAKTGKYVEAGTAVFEFRQCLITRFGLPNDEALPGHPLYHQGLDVYGCYEVLNSSWRAEAEAQNRVAFPATDYSSVRHFVFVFHDSCFECLAGDFDARLVDDFRSEFDRLADDIFSE